VNLFSSFPSISCNKLFNQYLRLTSISHFTSAAKSTENQGGNVAEKTEESADQNDIWEKLKEVAG
jgi:hypothetical protein